MTTLSRIRLYPRHIPQKRHPALSSRPVAQNLYVRLPQSGEFLALAGSGMRPEHRIDVAHRLPTTLLPHDQRLSIH